MLLIRHRRRLDRVLKPARATRQLGGQHTHVRFGATLVAKRHVQRAQVRVEACEGGRPRRRARTERPRRRRARHVAGQHRRPCTSCTTVVHSPPHTRGARQPYTVRHELMLLKNGFATLDPTHLRTVLLVFKCTFVHAEARKGPNKAPMFTCRLGGPRTRGLTR